MTQTVNRNEGTIVERKTVCVVISAQRIWKGRFFANIQQAAGVIREVYDKNTFQTQSGSLGTSLINEQDGSRFNIYEVDEYRDLNDVKQTTAF